MQVCVLCYLKELANYIKEQVERHNSNRVYLSEEECQVTYFEVNLVRRLRVQVPVECGLV